MVVADTPSDLLTRMTRLICRTVDGVEDCGIAVMHHGRAVTVACSSDLAALNDEIQYAAEAGPCLQTLESGSAVQSEDLTDESRWGRYPAAAAGGGMRSVLSLPIDAAEAGRGALNLYSQVAHAFDENDRLACTEFAGIIAGVVVATAHIEANPTLAGRFRQTLVHRSEVAQAVGVLMARHRCGPEQAFPLLLAGRERGEDLYAAAARIGASARPQS
ncbi:GAF and ANTAR domain-containing protein [Actinoallomurus bryophytorum]|uniref:ANTAR domain-containing protein n=1 Tax=Actinoallomurus bryophytorum TaxID=1490222 RepID=A0A543CJY2_9ACTN|nr:GAF and ANTAR domain-containing protein [Actinoallomurus bryophytorum]TQL97197.1 ANTAR domain-containing protein [Actinoallomurus bryophytorum]